MLKVIQGHLRLRQDSVQLHPHTLRATTDSYNLLNNLVQPGASEEVILMCFSFKLVCFLSCGLDFKFFQMPQRREEEGMASLKFLESVTSNSDNKTTFHSGDLW